MSVTCGFYNSLNGDRKYDGTQISSIFDGLITDGVFASIGTAFAVKAAGGLTVNVGIGKAWFNHTWTVNDSILPMTAPEAEVLLDRIDAVVLEVNGMESVRDNAIKFVTGTPSSSPTRPTLKAEDNIHQYPLAYIYRKYGSSTISQADITPMVGTESTPFITAMLQTISLDELLGKWQEELDQFVSVSSNKIDTWISSEETDFTTWFNSIKNQLSGDVAGNLANRIDALDTKTTQMQTTFNQYYHDGMMFLPSYQEKMVVMTGDAINVSLASVFKKEVSSAVTLSFSSTDSIGEGYVYSLLLVLKMTASVSVTFPTSVKWAGDTPALENGKTYEIVMRTYDGGTSWIASAGEGADNA